MEGAERRGEAVTRRRTGEPPALVLTCEHAGNLVPRPYARLFAGAKGVLRSHEGWDAGALQLARLLARRFDRPLLVTRWTRLLVEANRSLTNPRIWSRFSKDLPAEEKQRVIDRYWRPHRQEVTDAIEAALGQAPCVVHVAVHSFTPVLHGEVRTADVALLYDSRRAREAALARSWGASLARRSPGLRVRYNYPYRGAADGLATWLRRQHPAARYLGYELEVNQALATSAAWRSAGNALADALAEALADGVSDGRGATASRAG